MSAHTPDLVGMIVGLALAFVALASRRWVRLWLVVGLWCVGFGVFVLSLLALGAPWRDSTAMARASRGVVQQANTLGAPRTAGETYHIAATAARLAGTDYDVAEIFVTPAGADRFTVSLQGDSVRSCLTYDPATTGWHWMRGACAKGERSRRASSHTEPGTAQTAPYASKGAL
jgi:hypothetical protein